MNDLCVIHLIKLFVKLFDLHLTEGQRVTEIPEPNGLVQSKSQACPLIY